MSDMNWGRVIGGGIVAGVVMNASRAALHGGVLGGDGEALNKLHNLTPQPWQMAALVGVTFVIGIASVWLYAAIRPRFGAGPGTAICAGLAVWVIAHVWSGVYLGAAYTGLIPERMAWLPVAWGLVEAPLCTMAGAFFYKE